MTFGQTFEMSDLLTVLILVILEGLLSGDNALVLAVMVMTLPKDQQQRALRYGILGAFVLRTVAIFLAVWLTKALWVSLLGGLYLLWLPLKHFTQHPDEEHSGANVTAKSLLGLSVFWSIVVKVELTDLVFAVDSILAAVALTKGDPAKVWVVITGGVLGLIMMRVLTLKVLQLIEVYPKLIDGAYIVVAWVGIKLVVEFLHKMHYIPWHIPKEWGIGIVLLLFAGSFIYARRHKNEEGALGRTIDDAQALFGDPHPYEDGRSAPDEKPDA